MLMRAILVTRSRYYKFGAVNSFLAWRLGSLVFVPAMTIAPGVFGRPKFEALDSIEKMQEVRAEVGVQWLLLTRTMEASRRVVEIVRKLEELVGQVSRVTELMQLLESVEAAKADEYTQNFQDGDVIEFKGVSIVTPASPPVKLVENLSFRLEKGSSLLLTGPNGAGTSSIFRCLGGLWAIPTGTIVKPGGASSSGLHHSMFYLPRKRWPPACPVSDFQFISCIDSDSTFRDKFSHGADCATEKPYNVLGTLVDQMTYPADSSEEAISHQALFEVLDQVDLTYLLDRRGVLESEINVSDDAASFLIALGLRCRCGQWEDALSLGEKQRLAIARLIWHR
eukprot:SAG25_NODE_648_length_6205_cov_2.314609_6_plen_338_part_00